MTRATVYRLVDPQQLRVMASPVRQRLVAAFEALGAASARELAEHLGRSPESLYFHLRRLEGCGLVEGAGERSVGRHSERVYRLVADRLRLDGDLSRPAYRDALAGTCRSIMRATQRDWVRALESGEARLQGSARNLAMHHYHVHLKPADRRTLVRLLEELTSFVLEHNDPERGELHSFTSALAPVVHTSGARHA